MSTSGTAVFSPSIADLIVECFARVQIHAPTLQTHHIIEARRSANLILTDWSANRGVNLWGVESIHFGLQAGRGRYYFPDDTIQLLDVYIRRYGSGITKITPTILGNALTPMAAGGVPIIGVNGDPSVIAPSSNTLSATQNSQTITLNWPGNGLQVGDPIYFPYVASIGGLALSGLFVVDFVSGQDTISFNALDPAIETQSLQGATPLLQTTGSSANVFVIYPSHGKQVGDTFNVWSATTVGGITLNGTYTITDRTSSYQFTIVAANTAVSNDAVFIDGGIIKVSRNAPGTAYEDISVEGISRSEFAAIVEKRHTGRPSSFWFDRIMPPTTQVWPVPDASDQYGLIAYRMRQIQDANPVLGQTPDFPNRFLPAFTAELTAALAEKFKPELLKDKIAIAADTWPRAAQEDRELVPFYITPGLSGYFR